MTSEEFLSKLEEAVSVADHYTTMTAVNGLLQQATEENIKVLCPIALDPDRPGSGNFLYLMNNGKRHYVLFTSDKKSSLFYQTFGQRTVSLIPVPFRDFLNEVKQRDAFGGVSINPTADSKGNIDPGYMMSLMSTQYWPERRK